MHSRIINNNSIRWIGYLIISITITMTQASSSTHLSSPTSSSSSLSWNINNNNNKDTITTTTSSSTTIINGIRPAEPMMICDCCHRDTCIITTSLDQKENIIQHPQQQQVPSKSDKNDDKINCNKDSKISTKSTTTNTNIVNTTTTATTTTIIKSSGSTVTTTTSSSSNKRMDYLSWDDYFILTAILSSYRSKDPYRRIGCCIVDTKNRIIGTGYNGFPIGCSDDILPWTSRISSSTTTTTKLNNNNNDKEQQQQSTSTSTSRSSIPWLHTSDPYVVPAEINAILNKCSADCYGARLYTVRYPSNECAKIIIQSGITEVVYLEDSTNNNSSRGVEKNDDDNNNDNNNNPDDAEDPHEAASIRASRILFGLAGVKTRAYQSSLDHVVLNFTKALLVRPNNNEDGMDGTNQEEGKEDSTVHTSSTDKKSLEQNLVDQKETLRHKELLYKDILLKEASYDITNVPEYTVLKRTNALPWDDYFMGMAFLTAQRSKDPNTQVGACLVDPITKKILGLGYNGFPIGCSDDTLPWSRTAAVPVVPPVPPTTTAITDSEVTINNDDNNKDLSNPLLQNQFNRYPTLQTKYMYVVHAEQNAILNKGSANVVGATLYVALFPCNECAKVLIQAGIKEIVYMNDPYHNTDSCIASRILFSMAGITVRKHIPSIPSLTLYLK